MVTEIWFYHLDHRPLEQMIPVLLEKSQERGWRAFVRFATQERLVAMDQWLWVYREDSFLAHGSAEDDLATLHPVLLSLTDENRNQAHIGLCLEGTDPLQLLQANPSGFQRVVVIFRGEDAHETTLARQFWKKIDPKIYDRSYWQPDASGKWHKNA